MFFSKLPSLPVHQSGFGTLQNHLSDHILSYGKIKSILSKSAVVDRYRDSTQYREKGKGKEVDNIRDTRYKKHNRVNHIVDRYKYGEGITRSKIGHLLLSILNKVNAKFFRRIILYIPLKLLYQEEVA